MFGGESGPQPRHILSMKQAERGTISAEEDSTIASSGFDRVRPGVFSRPSGGTDDPLHPLLPAPLPPEVSLIRPDEHWPI